MICKTDVISEMHVYEKQFFSKPTQLCIHPDEWIHLKCNASGDELAGLDTSYLGLKVCTDSTLRVGHIKLR